MKNIAVITGASSGMGKEFVKQLDNEHFDEVWAIALDNEGLEELKKEVKTPVRCFAWDLTDKKNIDQYKQLLNDERPNIQWLVNASGFGKFGRWDEIPLEDAVNMIELNDIALVNMTQLSLPFMHQWARIVEIASVAAYQPIPYMAVYGASKAFVLSYSRAINVELKPRNISVTCVCPYWTATKFFDRAKITKHDVVSKYAVMYSPKDVVARAIKDAYKRKEISIYGSVARSQTRMVKLLPHKMVMSIWNKQQKMKDKYK